MNDEMQDRLKNAREKRQLMALYRDGLEQSADYTGVPVLLCRELVVLLRENDFAPDGYAAMRVADITYMEQVDESPFIRKLLAGEKFYDRVATPRLVGAESWKSLLDGVKASFGGWLTVETMGDEGCCFFMGSIARLDSNFLYLRQVEADGTIHQEETTIPLQDIITVTFGGRYIETYRKYLQGK